MFLPYNQSIVISYSMTGAFSIYDVDDDGYVTKEEMIKIVRAVFEKKGFPETQSAFIESRVETIFSEMDAVSIDTTR